MAEDLTTDWWNAQGPLEPIRPHIGAIDTVGDIDWFYFYTSATGEVKIGMNRTSGDYTHLDLYRWDGGKLVDVGDASTSYSSPYVESLPAGLYYARLSSGSVSGYDFTVSGGGVTASSPYVSSVLGNKSTLTHGKTYSFSGYAYPAPKVALKVFRYGTKQKKYVLCNTRPTKISSTGTPRKFATTWRPTQAGKYRLHWQTTGPGGMAPGASVYRYVKVK